MDKISLREAFIAQLWRMYKLDIMLYLREFLVGETAALEYIATQPAPCTPSEISDSMRVSRARTANVLRSLREKGYVDMRTDEDDRRRVNVTVTDDGLKCLAEKHEFLADYFDMYIGEIGEENAGRMTELLKLTADCAPSLMERIMRERNA